MGASWVLSSVTLSMGHSVCMYTDTKKYSLPFHEVVDSSRELYNVITNIFKILPSKFYNGLSLKDRYWILLCMPRLQTTG